MIAVMIRIHEGLPGEIPGLLTTDHPASVGQPVAVADDGRVFGPDECQVVLLEPPDDDEQVRIVEAANWVGYVIEPAAAPA